MYGNMQTCAYLKSSPKDTDIRIKYTLLFLYYQIETYLSSTFECNSIAFTKYLDSLR